MKASLITYAKQLSQAHGENGVRVNVVSPGPIYFDGGAWDMIKISNEKFYIGITEKTHALGRLGITRRSRKLRCLFYLARPQAG